MPINTIRTVAYLDPGTRRRIDEFAERSGLTVSEAMRECVQERVGGRLTVERGRWVEIALGVLLRSHPTGDLEGIVDAVIASEARLRRRG